MINEKGFSLVELSVAAAVAVGLATVAVAVVSGTATSISDKGVGAASIEECTISEALKSGGDSIINDCYVTQNGVSSDVPNISEEPSTSTAPSSMPEPEEPAPPTNLTIFDATTGPNSSATGGWTTSLAGGTTQPVLSLTSNSIGLRAPYWADGDAYTVNDIDFTNVTSMTLTFSSSGVSPSYFYSNINWPLAGGGEAGYPLGSPSYANVDVTTVTIPIENGGVGKLRLRVTNSNGGYVYLYNLVLNY